ncbi:hypothetical protein, partial [Salibacterium qingdaonense]|uniref:hypothetical protein n=1 Tax=Salibacterium qingdaonense TaxID=266892 RepID=UPI001C43505E
LYKIEKCRTILKNRSAFFVAETNRCAKMLRFYSRAQGRHRFAGAHRVFFAAGTAQASSEENRFLRGLETRAVLSRSRSILAPLPFDC